jgi:hypothetical protein
VSLEEGVQRTVPWFRRALEEESRESGGLEPRSPMETS